MPAKVWEVILYLALATVGILTFLQYIVRLYYPIAEYMKYHLFIAGIVVFFLLVRDQFAFETVTFLLVFIGLTAIISTLLYCSQYQEIPQNTKEITVRKILAGQRIL